MKSTPFKLILAFCLGSALMWYVGGGKRTTDTPTPPVMKPESAKQETAKPEATNAPPSAPQTNATPPKVVATNTPPNVATNNVAATNLPPTTPEPVVPKPEPEAKADVQVSFKGSQIDQVIEWLAKQTGKSVIKHPQARVQLTIVSSQKVTQRQAIDLVYRAIAVEGFSVIEDEHTILIVPDGKEPKLRPRVVGADENEIPDGRQQIVKIIDLEHATAADLKDRCRSVLSEKAKIEVDELGNKLIVTDYTEPIGLLMELIPSFDQETEGDTIVHIFPLEYLEADEISQLLGLILNDDKPSSSSSSSSSRSRYSSYSRSRSSSSRSPSPASASASVGKDLKFWPDRNGNRLIASLPKSRLQEITDLIDMLDTEKPKDVGVRVLPLQHVDAEDLVDEIAPLYRKLGGQSLKETVEITANERSNSLIILSSESNFENIEKFIKQLDTEDALEQVMDTIPLENADSEDVAEQLRELTQGQQPVSRYTYYYRSPSGSSSKQMNIVADRRRNSVIVQASPAEIVSVKKMIQVLDEPVGEDALAPKIFQLQYVSAVDIEDVLNELFVKKEQRRSYWDFYGDGGGDDAGPMNVGRLNGKVRVTSEPFSNSLIIAANSVEAMEAVEAVIKQLDVASPAGESTMRIELKFANAIEVANSLNVLFAQDGAPALRPQSQGQPRPSNNNQNNQNNNNQNQQRDGFVLERESDAETYFPWLGGQQGNRSRDGTIQRPASEMVGRVRVVPDKRSNSLLITTDLHYFPQVVQLVADLDAPTAQILIEAKIVEVSSDFRDRLGVRMAPGGSGAFDSEDLDGAFRPTVGADFMNVLLGSFGTNALRSGVLNSSVNIDFLVQFLKRNTDATVLAEPKISVSDNELGKLFVGSQVPFISGSINTGIGGRNDSFNYRDVGIILEVTPQINNSEEIALRIHVESSSIRENQTLFGGAILDTRSFRTDLMVKTGQTVVLGGIIQKEEGEVIRKTPLLGDIPGLGWAFKKKDKTTRNVELMVFLRPVITRSPEEAKALVEEIQSRMPVLQRWQKEEEALKKANTTAEMEMHAPNIPQPDSE